MSRAYDAAARILALAAEGLAAAGRAEPERIVVAPGPDPVFEWGVVDQLVVAVQRPSVPGTVQTELRSARHCPGPRFCELRVELTRCVPSGDGESPPTVEEYQAAAEGLLDDVEALQAALTPEALAGRPGGWANIDAFVLAGPAGGLCSASVVVAVPL